MTVDDSIFAALGPLVANRVYPSTFPQQFTYPAIRYQFVDQVPVADLGGDGDEQTDTPRVQIDAVANTYKAARDLGRAIREAMKTITTPAMLEDQRPVYDADAKVHRVSLDYTFHGSSVETS